MIYRQQDREFTATEHSELAQNYKRVLEQTSEKTRANYLKRFESLCLRAEKKAKTLGLSNIEAFNQEISAIEDKRRSGMLKQSSVRQYKASILYGLTCLYEMASKSDSISDYGDVSSHNFSLRLANEIGVSGISSVYSKVHSWQAEEASKAKQLDNKAHLEANTSSRKAKLFDKNIYQHLMSSNDERTSLLRLFIKINIKLGLRPNEWFSARLVNKTYFELLTEGLINSKNAPTYGLDEKITESDKSLITQSRFLLGALHSDLMHEYAGKSSRPVLVVKNSKNTHGRANGSYRYILLDGLPDEDMLLLPSLITRLHQKHAESVPDASKRDVASFNTFVAQPLQNQLKYWLETDAKCQEILQEAYDKKLKSYTYEMNRAKKTGSSWSRQEPIKEYPTLYSTRHQAVSDAKAVGMSPIVMAALFGHASVVTADRHYGRMVDSWGAGIVTPHQESINKVLIGLTEPQIEDMFSQAAKQIDIVAAYKNLISINPEFAPASGHNLLEIDVQASSSEPDRHISIIVDSDNNLHPKLSLPLKNIANKTTSSRSQGRAKNKPARARVKKG